MMDESPLGTPVFAAEAVSEPPYDRPMNNTEELVVLTREQRREIKTRTIDAVERLVSGDYDALTDALNGIVESDLPPQYVAVEAMVIAAFMIRRSSTPNPRLIADLRRRID
jgi:hypothetical protein